MRRHNKKGNGFYKIAETIPKYVSIEAVLVKVAQDYLRKIAQSSDIGARNPSTQNAPHPTAAGPSASQSGGASSGSGRASATGTLPSEPSAGQPPVSVNQEATSQSAGLSPVPGAAVSSQPGATKTREKTDVVGAPSRKEPPNYLKNLALLAGVPLTVASLASGAIRGFGMSNLIGLGLGAVATAYGFGFLDSILHPKVMLYEEFEKLERREAGQFLSDPQRAIDTVNEIYGANRTLLGIPRDFSPGKTPPNEFRKLYEAAHDYIMKLYHEERLDSKFGLYKIFGYENIGAPPQDDILNSLDKGRDLDRHATLIVLANILKRIERHPEGGRKEAAKALQRLVEKAAYWYWSPWTFTGGSLGIRVKRPYIADPRTLKAVLQDPKVVFPGKEDVIKSLTSDVFSKHLVEAALNFGFEDTEEKAQTR